MSTEIPPPHWRPHDVATLADDPHAYAIWRQMLVEPKRFADGGQPRPFLGAETKAAWQRLRLYGLIERSDAPRVIGWRLTTKGLEWADPPKRDKTPPDVVQRLRSAWAELEDRRRGSEIRAAHERACIAESLGPP